MPKSAPPDADPAPGGLTFRGVRVEFREAGKAPFLALDVPSLDIGRGEMVALGGPSGSGKTTLLHLAAGLMPPGTGEIRFDGEPFLRLPESRRDAWRRHTIGLVFQDFHLFPEMDALGNILLPTTFGGARGEDWRHRARQLGEKLGIADLARPVGLLSRGEQQRVAVIRALLQRPRLLLADEPTASLDAGNAAAVGAALVDEARDLGATLICATHDPVLAGRFTRHLHLAGGRIIRDEAQA